MAEFLVTGGAGFIGCNIVRELVRRKEKVRVLDNFSTGKRENLSDLLDGIELIEGDIRSYSIVREAVEGIDFILHQAALPSVPRSIRDPITTNEVNVTGTIHILDAARDAKAGKVIFASSSSIYGDLDTLLKTENMLPHPLSPYAVAKLAGEKYCEAFTRLYGLETIALRYFNVFGPNQDPNSQYSAVIPKFIIMIMQKQRPTIFGDGKQSRDFTFVDNVVQANLMACESDLKELSGQVINIAAGKRVTIDDLVQQINRCLGSDIMPIYADPRPGDVKHSLANIGKAQQLLNYKVRVDFVEGLQTLVDLII
jgi:UDP-glucose 4-epimerase